MRDFFHGDIAEKLRSTILASFQKLSKQKDELIILGSPLGPKSQADLLEKKKLLEVQGSLGESSEIFITRLCKLHYRSHDDQPAGSFLKQRISMALQIGNAACVLGTVSDRDAFEQIYYI